MSYTPAFSALGLICFLFAAFSWRGSRKEKEAEPEPARKSYIQHCTFDATVEGPVKITKPGIIVITADRVVMDGFEIEGDWTCDADIFTRWGIERLKNPTKEQPTDDACRAIESE